MSELKAALAEAYAKGDEPKFQYIMPTGDEVWNLGSALFVLPSIPPGAPPELEYALRVRRDAVFSGTCEECNASLDVDPFGRLDGIDAAAGIIPHRRNCPASDENVIPQLRRAREERASASVGAVLEAASRATRLRVEEKIPVRRMIRSKRFEAWGRRLLDRQLEEVIEQCDHLRMDPAQTWNLLLGATSWNCNECWEYHNLEIARGNSPISDQEDFTCDYCRTVHENLEPLVLRIGTFILHGGLCQTCSKRSMETNGKPRRKGNGTKRRGRR
ncbi:hypothetical protein [Streptomyces sp. NPDC088733]|uniref:hypothetical protein n=1 Tax=Streptomyces sp. NPDC088733 TaxID=3365880 RepID=UPI0038199405